MDGMTMWCIQYVEPAKDAAEAQAMLDAMRQMHGYIGGRVLAAGPGKPDRMQAFFADEPDVTWLPDGMRRVLIPDGQRNAMGIF